jgi:hypothetical protein
MDQESDEVFVLMDADAYEAMLPETSPKPKSQDEEGLEDYVLDDILDIEESRQTDAEPLTSSIPSRFTVEKEHQAPRVNPAPAPSPKQNLAENWEKPAASPILNEENLSDVPDDGEEEEKFYLEPVE